MKGRVPQPAPSFVDDDVFALVGDPDQPRIPNDAGHEPDIRLFCGIEAENAECAAERACRKVGEAFSKNVTLGFAIEFGLVDLPQPMLARNVFVARRRCFTMFQEALGKITVADLVEHVEGINQQTFSLGRGIGDRVDVRSIFGTVPAFETQRCVDANGAWIEHRSQFEID